MFKSRNTMTSGFITSNSIMDGVSGCWVWDGYCQNGGYGQFRFNGRSYLAHRASYAVHSDLFCLSSSSEEDRLFRVFTYLKDMRIGQRCGNKKCVNPDHLFAEPVVRKSSILSSGDFSFRGNNRVKKLTDGQAAEIRGSTGRLRSIAREYGVSESHVSMIRNGKRRKS
jgi:homing endonuclease-like protein